MDKSESEKLSVIKALQGAKKLIKSPANWCQGHMVRDDKGQRVGSIWAQEATKYCGYAALARVCVKPSDDEAHDLHHECLLIMHKALREIEGKEECSIVVYNDRHTHDDMLSLFDKAIELAGSNDEEEEKGTKIHRELDQGKTKRTSKELKLKKPKDKPTKKKIRR